MYLCIINFANYYAYNLCDIHCKIFNFFTHVTHIMKYKKNFDIGKFENILEINLENLNTGMCCTARNNCSTELL